MTTADQQILNNIAEYKRLCRLTTFQRIHDTVDRRRMHLNGTGKTLSPAQLENDPDDDLLTVVAYSMDQQQPLGRSTQHTSQTMKSFVVVHRPCERRAFDHLNGCWVYDDELPELIVHRPAQQRWCIWCKDRHPRHAFIRHSRYLHGLSYACADAVQRRKRLRWSLTA